MKEDYLWDKKGSDSEIEGLENSLREFRISNTTAPKLPQKTFALDENSSQSKKPFWFSLKVASAAFACLAFAIVSIGAFQFLNNGEQKLVQNTSEQKSKEFATEKPIKVEEKTLEETKTIQPKVVEAKFTKKPKQRIVKADKPVRTKVKAKRFVARKVKANSTKPKATTIRLTKEEKAAYDQLMRALAITGSQMRLVQEKINGVEETPATKKNGSQQ